VGLEFARTLSAAILVIVLFTGCGVGAGRALPPETNLQSRATNADSFMRSITPKSALPNTVPIPPMLGLDAVRSAMSLRKPQSAIMPLGFSQIPGAASQVAAAPDGSAWVLGNSGPTNGELAVLVTEGHHWSHDRALDEAATMRLS
jgi:hypothetical protein